MCYACTYVSTYVYFIVWGVRPYIYRCFVCGDGLGLLVARLLVGRELGVAEALVLGLLSFVFVWFDVLFVVPFCYVPFCYFVCFFFVVLCSVSSVASCMRLEMRSLIIL